MFEKTYLWSLIVSAFLKRSLVLIGLLSSSNAFSADSCEQLDDRFYKVVDGIEIGYKMVNGVRVPPSEEEIAEFVQRAKDHEKEMAANELVKYRDQRFMAYQNRGADIQSVVEALRESIMENRPEKLQTIQAIVDQVKLEFPKPIALQDDQNDSSWIDWLFELPQKLIWR